MTQIFVVGSSNAYGVGGELGGWADMIKLHLHDVMYRQDGKGERHEVYNFSMSGVTASFVADTFPAQLAVYGRKNWRKIAIMSVGGNNIKAVNEPDNYTSTLEEFAAEMKELIANTKGMVDQLIIMGFRPYDESKTMPKKSPFTGSVSYFGNERRIAFNNELKKICERENVSFIETGMPDDEWISTCLYDDGLHPNNKGHQAMAAAVLQEIEL